MTQILGENVILERGLLGRCGAYLPSGCRTLILTDDGVPAEYVRAVAAASSSPLVITLPAGEQNKCLATYGHLIGAMTEAGFDRTDAVVAVGGGVVGDLGGFVAATYMRGIGFYNVPTTLLSQIDSSVGGKTAVDFGGYKNLIGAFYPARRVLIDPDVLGTLDKRQFAAGMAEAVKMFATLDGEGFALLEAGELPTDEIIRRAVACKLRIVSADEKEADLRRVLNFGHTVGHAVEAVSQGDKRPLLHGECVAVGMLAVTAGEVRERLRSLLGRWGLPTSYRCHRTALLDAVAHDKKSKGSTVTAVLVDEIGSFRFARMTPEELINQCGEAVTFL